MIGIVHIDDVTYVTDISREKKDDLIRNVDIVTIKYTIHNT